ncbi:MAG TPA: glycosyltransferase family 39 protein [Bacteroidia bacterium]|jgi:4-amino-4-deoxy-L-arabinose transferase-like glycosyltransferase|nr:glycosyltransferase family 39 protein [Bacteroidia bacterium]
MVFGTQFNSNDFRFLLLGALFIIASLLLFRSGKTGLSLVFLSMGAFAVRFFMIRLDPFLNIWDEQFHALVAKNMMVHPFTPMLYTKAILYKNPDDWICGHIWLHKEPFFLWVIALSYKVFGVNEIALRLPSALLTTGMIIMVYRMGKLLINNNTGYYAAFLFALANYQLEMVTGGINCDHHDVFFMVFVAATFWSWIEYKHSGKFCWVLCIGIFSGIAVLIKWLTGLLIFGCWGITILFDKEKRFHIRAYRDIVISFLLAVIIFLPWVIYSFVRFPVEAATVYASYSAHFTTVLENHAGDHYYHLDLISPQYGWIVPFVIIPALYLLYKKLKEKKQELILLTSWLLLVHIFYAITKTKMPLFTIIVCPVIFIALGSLLSDSINFIEAKVIKFAGVIVIAMLLAIGYFNLNLTEIEARNTDISDMKGWRDGLMQNNEIYKKLPSILHSKDYVIFNCKPFSFISAMYYSGFIVYPDIPDSATYIDLKKQNIPMAIFKGANIPSYITKDSATVKLNFDIF